MTEESSLPKTELNTGNSTVSTHPEHGQLHRLHSPCDCPHRAGHNAADQEISGESLLFVKTFKTFLNAVLKNSGQNN